MLRFDDGASSISSKSPRSKPDAAAKDQLLPLRECVRPETSKYTSAVHQDFIRYGNRSSVTIALIMVQLATAAAEALTYGLSSTPAAIKSIHFGQQQQMALQKEAEKKRNGQHQRVRRWLLPGMSGAKIWRPNPAPSRNL